MKYLFNIDYPLGPTLPLPNALLSHNLTYNVTDIPAFQNVRVVLECISMYYRYITAANAGATRRGSCALTVSAATGTGSTSYNFGSALPAIQAVSAPIINFAMSENAIVNLPLIERGDIQSFNFVTVADITEVGFGALTDLKLQGFMVLDITQYK